MVAEVSSRLGISVSGLISIYSFLHVGFLRQLLVSSIERFNENSSQFWCLNFCLRRGKKKKRRTYLGVSVWCSETTVNILSGFRKVCAFAVGTFSFLQEEGRPRFPSHGRHFPAPSLAVSSSSYWTIFKTGLKCCSRPSFVKCDPS